MKDDEFEFAGVMLSKDGADLVVGTARKVSATSDSVRSRPATAKYRNGWDNVFGKKQEQELN